MLKLKHLHSNNKIKDKSVVGIATTSPIQTSPTRKPLAITTSRTTLPNIQTSKAITGFRVPSETGQQNFDWVAAFTRP